jgi:CHASE1-domain containing sensor protein
VGRSNAGWAALRPGIDRFGRHLRRGAAAYGVLLIALLLTLLAFYYVRQNVAAEARTRFDETTQATKAAIYRRVNAYLAAMIGTRGLLRVSGSVEHDEWDGYVRSIEPGLRRNRLRKAQSLKGHQSLGLFERVQEQPTCLRARERCHRESLALRHHLDGRAQPYAGLPRKRGA